ncbi:MAG: glycosyltransferase family 61 protein [Caulobacterales bacterium]|nr:glycosyltransferase family 61 protein [Caulobacterales bacterium]
MTQAGPSAILALAAEFDAKRSSVRFLSLPDAPTEVLATASAPWRSVVLASLLGNEPAQTAPRIRDTGLFTAEEIAEGVRLNHLVAAARGDVAPRVHEARGTSGPTVAAHDLLNAALLRDFQGIIDAYNALPAIGQGSAEATLMAGYAFANLGQGPLGDFMMNFGVTRLVEDGDLFRPAFWSAIDLLMCKDVVAQSRLMARFVSTMGEQDPALCTVLSRGLVDACLGTPDDIKVTAADLISAIRSLIKEAAQLSIDDLDYLAGALSRIADVVEDETELKADALAIQALCHFVTGRTTSGLALRQQAVTMRGKHLDVARVLSAPLAGPDDLALLGSVLRLWRSGETFSPLDPMARVEGRPVANPYRPCEIWCAELRDAEVISGDTYGSVFHYVLTSEHSLLMDGLNLHPSYHIGQCVDAFRALSPTGEVLVDLSDRPAPKRLGDRAVLIGGVANYYHWLMEYLPRVGIARDAGLMDDDTRILVNAQPTGWQGETLDRLGISALHLVPLMGEQTLRAGHLVVPSLPSTQYAVQFLRRSFVPEDAAEPHRLIYVARLDCDASRSRVANEIDVARAMARLGAEILIPGEASFAEQVRMFAEAKVVVGPHGAGLTNIAFCPPATHVLEIVNSINVDYVFFERIAEAAGLNFDRWTSPRELSTDEPENAPSIIDIDRLVDAVTALMRT